MCLAERRLLVVANYIKNAVSLRRLERVFRYCSVCETMEDYKGGYLMVWTNYVSLQLYCWTIL